MLHFPADDIHPPSVQRLLMGRLGSAKLDSTIACSIMFLCDACDDDTRGDGKRPPDADAGATAERAETAQGQPEGGGGSGSGRKSDAKRKRRARGKKGAREPDWGAWSQKQLTSLVWALNHSNQDVLTYTAWTV